MNNIALKSIYLVLSFGLLLALQDRWPLELNDDSLEFKSVVKNDLKRASQNELKFKFSTPIIFIKTNHLLDLKSSEYLLRNDIAIFNQSFLTEVYGRAPPINYYS